MIEVSETADQPMTDHRAELETVYAAEHESLVRTAALVTGSAAEAEDIVQEAFAKLYPRLGRIDNPAAWLRTVVVNAARNDIRRMIVRRRYLARAGPLVASSPAAPPIHELIDSLRQLPPRQRAVVVLRFYEDRTEAEIASILGVRPGTVKSSLHRALSTLRQEINRD